MEERNSMIITLNSCMWDAILIAITLLLLEIGHLLYSNISSYCIFQILLLYFHIWLLSYFLFHRGIKTGNYISWSSLPLGSVIFSWWEAISWDYVSRSHCSQVVAEGKSIGFGRQIRVFVHRFFEKPADNYPLICGRQLKSWLASWDSFT